MLLELSSVWSNAVFMVPDVVLYIPFKLFSLAPAFDRPNSFLASACFGFFGIGHKYYSTVFWTSASLLRLSGLKFAKILVLVSLLTLPVPISWCKHRSLKVKC